MVRKEEEHEMKCCAAETAVVMMVVSLLVLVLQPSSDPALKGYGRLLQQFPLTLSAAVSIFHAS